MQRSPGTRTACDDLVAQVAGVASHVPGVLGIFELILLEFFPGSVAGSALLASLLAYRAVHYLLPLLIAAALLVAREAAQTEDHGCARGDPLRPLVAGPPGASGDLLPFRYRPARIRARPAATGRLGALGQMLPLAGVELSHFAGSLAGASLRLDRER